MTEVPSQPSSDRSIGDLIYLGLNSRVVALDRYTGEIVWTWKSPEGSGNVLVMVDADRIIASVMGYMYCLDPLFGQEVWRNQLKGYGVGIPSIASVNASTNVQAQASHAAAAAAAQAAQTAAATTVIT
jgi:outer membrane protein assembly factor BamB